MRNKIGDKYKIITQHFTVTDECEADFDVCALIWTTVPLGSCIRISQRKWMITCVFVCCVVLAIDRYPITACCQMDKVKSKVYVVSSEKIHQNEVKELLFEKKN
jgi:hypothetical protein